MCNNQVRLIFLVIFFCLVTGQESGDPKQRCAPQTVTCICQTESNTGNLSVTVEKYVFKSFDLHHKKCYPLRHAENICMRMSCEFGPIEPETIEGAVIYYPIEISIPEGGDDHDLRSARDIRGCRLTGLKHARVKCWKWTEFVDCMIYCRVGYALRTENGSVYSKGFSCMYEDNKWFPPYFNDCEPYLNCDAHLIKAGSLKCKLPQEGPHYCEIGCEDYESEEPTPIKYVCKDENFGSTLPHCARLNNNERLLEKPKTTEEANEIEEEK